MTREEKDVFKANEAFYHAFENLDIQAMERLWIRESYVQCFHPGWIALRGWDPVMASWRRIFENTEEIRFLLTEVKVEVRQALAWVTMYENITSKVGEEMVSGVILTTNIFQRRAEGWFLIHHHGSNVVQPPAQLAPSTVH